MKGTHLDGLPGLTLQGKKGPTGIRGNKIFYISEGMTVKTDSSKSVVYKSARSIEDLINGKISSNTEILGFLDEDAYDYDYALYTSDNSTYLYMLTERKKIKNEKDDDSDSDEDSSTGDNLKEFNTWLIDSWTYSSVDVKDLDLAVDVENINIPYVPWNGEYFSNKAACIPQGTDNDGHIVPSGHEFSILNEDDFIEKVQNSANTFGICTKEIISGTVYSMEVDDKGNHIPLEGISIALRTLNDVVVLRGREQYSMQGETEGVTDKNGKFSISFTPGDESGYVTVLAYDKNRMYLSGNFIVTGSTLESEIQDMKLYLYDNAVTKEKIYGKTYSPKYDIRKDDGEDPAEPIFYVVDYFNYYDTSKTISDYNDLLHAVVQYVENDESSEESDDDTPQEVKYRNVKLSTIPLQRFIIYSSLSSEEKSKIRIEAEFSQNSNIKSAQMSSCKRDVWSYTKEEAETDFMYFKQLRDKGITSPFEPQYFNPDNESNYESSLGPAQTLPSGRYTGLNNTLNFDNEDLRDFKIVVKDYGEGIYTNKFVTYKTIPYNISEYTMYLYLYYKSAPSDISKTLLTSE